MPKKPWTGCKPTDLWQAFANAKNAQQQKAHGHARAACGGGPAASRAGGRASGAPQKSELAKLSKNTTLMFRNWPRDSDNRKLLELLKNNDFEYKYDFAYAPMDPKTESGRGWALVNMTSNDAARAAMDKLDESRERGPGSVEVLRVEWALVQGRKKLIDRYRDSPVMHPYFDFPTDRKPACFKDGVAQPFPSPTNLPSIQTPRAPIKTESDLLAFRATHTMKPKGDHSGAVVCSDAYIERNTFIDGFEADAPKPALQRSHTCPPSVQPHVVRLDPNCYSADNGCEQGEERYLVHNGAKAVFRCPQPHHPKSSWPASKHLLGLRTCSNQREAEANPPGKIVRPFVPLARRSLGFQQDDRRHPADFHSLPHSPAVLGHRLKILMANPGVRCSAAQCPWMALGLRLARFSWRFPWLAGAAARGPERCTEACKHARWVLYPALIWQECHLLIF